VKLWMDVMRDLELVLDDYDRLFDAWAEGGVDGLVIGPMVFDAAPLHFGAHYAERERRPMATFDPDPALYRRLGVEPPPAPEQQQPEKRAQLERALVAAKDRGWSVWIFTPAAGMGPGGPGHLLADEKSQAAFAARTLDTLAHYPMADGGIMDGPEWGYEIAPHHMNHRSDLFNDLPESIAPKCAALGYDYRALVAAKERLFARLHALTPDQVALHASGGLLGAFQLFGADPDLMAWLRFRMDSLTAFFASVRQAVEAYSSRQVKLGVGPRSASFAPLCGYDLGRLAQCIDILLPKHYFWQRGFDGMYGTVYRYVETLTQWSPALSDADALAVVFALFGLKLPDVADRFDLDAGFPPEFYECVVKEETRRALAAVDDPERIVPWVDAGRRPHDGDPMTAGELRRVLMAAEEAGLRRFLYHHAGNLSEGEWVVMSKLCGQAWQPLASDYRPPDAAIL